MYDSGSEASHFSTFFLLIIRQVSTSTELLIGATDDKAGSSRVTYLASDTYLTYGIVIPQQ